MNDIEKYQNITENSDCSLTFKSDEWEVNIYKHIDWTYEVRNRVWEIFVSEINDETCFKSLMNYMIESEQFMKKSERLSKDLFIIKNSLWQKQENK